MLQEVTTEQTVIDTADLKQLLIDSEAQKDEIYQLYKGSIKLLTLLGLAEKGKIKAEAFGEDGGALGEIIKEASSLIGLVMRSQAPLGMGKGAEKQLLEKFAFFSELIPLFIKYGKEFEGKITE